MKKYNPTKNVMQAAIERIDFLLDSFPAYYISFSGGKDSGAALQLFIERATAKNKLPVPVMFFDWETCYKATIEFVERQMFRKEVEPYWICLPEAEDNGSSIFERYWKPWDKTKRDKWVRPMPTHSFVINEDNMPEAWRPWYSQNSYSLWVVKRFGDWLAGEKGVDRLANILGLRTDESYGRHMLVAAAKNRDKLTPWCYRTKDSGAKTWVSLPIYDWRVEDIWTAMGKQGWDYNKTYDKFHWAGKTLHGARICNAFGEVQKKDLDQWHEIEPETWNRLVQRVEGANFGAIYNNTNLNSLRTKKPNHVTWEQFTWQLLESLPPAAQENYRYRFGVIIRWFETYSRDKLGLERWWFDAKKEAKAFVAAKGISIAYVGSWETMANFIIKRDWMCKKYGFKESKRNDEAISNLISKT
jgi:predicted phosphoadenosine phosphosulfate sulfurtransferase